MNGDLWKIFGMAILGIILLYPIKELKKEHFTLGITALSLSIMVVALKKAFPMFEYIKNLGFGEFSSQLGTAFTAFGIAVTTNIISQMCTDFGAGSISEKIEFVGRAAIIMSTLPLVETLISLMRELL